MERSSAVDADPVPTVARVWRRHHDEAYLFLGVILALFPLVFTLPWLGDRGAHPALLLGLLATWPVGIALTIRWLRRVRPIGPVFLEVGPEGVLVRQTFLPWERVTAIEVRVRKWSRFAEREVTIVTGDGRNEMVHGVLARWIRAAVRDAGPAASHVRVGVSAMVHVTTVLGLFAFFTLLFEPFAT